MRVAVWHVRGGVRVVEVDWRIMALVDMVCVHDTRWTRIARRREEVVIRAQRRRREAWKALIT